MIQFIKAIPNDTKLLRLLAAQSEAHWGYSEEFMKRFNLTFNITEEFINENPVYISWQDKKPIAFWGLQQSDCGWELEYFYVSEECLGKGYGKQMWNHMINWCKSEGIQEISFVTSVQAIGFYEKMGAIHEKDVPSTIDGRLIPYFIYVVGKRT